MLYCVGGSCSKSSADNSELTSYNIQPAWRDANAIGTHLVDAIAIAVQRCTGMALQASMDREVQQAMGAAAA